MSPALGQLRTAWQVAAAVFLAESIGLEVAPGMDRWPGVLTLGFLPHTAGPLIMQRVNN